MKRRNHLRNKGHIKTKKNKSKVYNVPQPPIHKRDITAEEIEEEEAENSDIGDDMLEMVDQDDLDFLKKNIGNQNYKLYNRIQMNNVNCNSFICLFFMGCLIMMSIFRMEKRKDLEKMMTKNLKIIMKTQI